MSKFSNQLAARIKNKSNCFGRIESRTSQLIRLRQEAIELQRQREVDRQFEIWQQRQREAKRREVDQQSKLDAMCPRDRAIALSRGIEL